jgi:hypothetical protein
MRISALARCGGYGRLAAGQRTEAVSLLVNVMHELTPAEDLANEALFARDRNIQLLRFLNDSHRQKSVDIQQRRDARMEQRGGVASHGVFVFAEER